MAIIEPLHPGSSDDWKTPEITIYDRLRIAREKAGIKSLHVMADMLSAELSLDPPLAGSTAAAWEKGTNQPSRRGVRFNEYVKAYSRITRTKLNWFYAESPTFGYKSQAAGERPVLTSIDGSGRGTHRPTRTQFFPALVPDLDSF